MSDPSNTEVRMKNTKFWDTLRKVLIIISILEVSIIIVPPFFQNQIPEPHLTYECWYYPLTEGKSLATITVRNEGRVTAHDVTMIVYTKGEIENVMGQIGAITEKIEAHSVLMMGEASFNTGPENSCYAEIKYIPSGMKYTFTLIVRYGGVNPIEGEPLIYSVEGGRVEPYTPMQNSNLFLKFFILGLIGGICLTGAIFSLYLKKKKD